MRARCSHEGDIFQSAKDAGRTESDRRDSMRYIVTLSKEADAEILSILSYIAALSQSHDTALESALAQLANAPHSGSLPRCAPRIRRGYRVLAVDKCLLFHTIDDAAGRVLLHHIFDSRTAYQEKTINFQETARGQGHFLTAFTLFSRCQHCAASVSARSS